MRNLIVGTAAGAVLALVAPAAVADKPATESASKACKAERTAMGAEAFAEKYGTNRNNRNAFGKCVSATSQERPGRPPRQDPGHRPPG